MKGRTGLRVLPANEGAPASEAARGESKGIGFEEVRQRLGNSTGRQFWRSLEELAQTSEFQELASKEFKRYLPEIPDVDRRHFLQLAGASLALAGLTGCTRQPDERLVPYVKQPESIVPGRPLFFATAMTLGGYATGLLVESHMGRPTKAEGNPEHPASLGATDVFAQASVLDLYDPDRLKSLSHHGRLTQWEAFTEILTVALRAQEALGGEGVRVLSGTVTSPTLAAQAKKLQERLPEARWHQYEAAGRDNVRNGARMAYGDWAETRYDLSSAKVVVTLDADFFNEGPGHLAYARGFAQGRRPESGELNRLYTVESTPTPTGTMADHRLPLRAGEIGGFALALAAELGVSGAQAPANFSRPEAAQYAAAIAKDLSAHAGECLVVAGEAVSAEVHALVHAINESLGNLGKTVVVTDPVEAMPEDQLASLRELVQDMNEGRVELLLILGGNPVFDAPADLSFREALDKVDQRIYLGLYSNETAERCQWQIPEAHYLEGWSDARAFDGTISIVQPLIEPLYEGRTAHELLAVMLGEQGTAYQLVESHWREQSGGVGFERAWRKALHDGVVADSALPPKAAAVQGGGVSEAVSTLASGHRPEGLELALRTDPAVYDGRFANNGWLQEMPNPVNKLTWDNALMISPATVKSLGLAGVEKRNLFLPDELHGAAAEAAHLISASGKMVRLTLGEQSLEVPIWVQPGQADGTLTLHLGHGRERAGRVGNGTGFNAYPLRSSENPWLAGDVKIDAVEGRYELASTQLHQNIPVEGQEAEKRHLVRVTTADEYQHNPKVIHDMGHSEEQHLSLFPDWSYEGYRWGMTIDLNSCMGCNACVVACQSENNIPVVGKQEVINGREMHWIRIDRYYAGSDIDNPEIHNQPIPCMQCEKAPCEVVCPVGATVHSAEGLNDMVYNRCVGTRYCSNNCPYKVRRFNFFNFNRRSPNVEQEVALGRNPDVTVRFRGVMEKCTYCVQRINQVRVDAKLEDGRPMLGDPANPDSYRPRILPGELVTACQAACPTQAISFGDLNDPEAEVVAWKNSPRNYGLLEELGTLPRTTYLAKVTNPNPELETETRSDSHGGH